MEMRAPPPPLVLTLPQSHPYHGPPGDQLSSFASFTLSTHCGHQSNKHEECVHLQQLFLLPLFHLLRILLQHFPRHDASFHATLPYTPTTMFHIASKPWELSTLYSTPPLPAPPRARCDYAQLARPHTPLPSSSP